MAALAARRGAAETQRARQGVGAAAAAWSSRRSACRTPATTSACGRERRERRAPPRRWRSWCARAPQRPHAGHRHAAEQLRRAGGLLGAGLSLQRADHRLLPALPEGAGASAQQRPTVGVPPRWGLGRGTGWMIEGCLWDRMGWGERPVCRCGLAHFPFSERSSERMLLPGKNALAFLEPAC